MLPTLEKAASKGTCTLATLSRTGTKVDVIKDFPRPVSVGKDTKLYIPDVKGKELCSQGTFTTLNTVTSPYKLSGLPQTTMGPSVLGGLVACPPLFFFQN